MDVMPANMPDAGTLRGERRRVRRVGPYGVHVGAKGDERTGLCAVKQRNHAMSADAFGYVKAQLFQTVRNFACRARFFIG